MTEKNSFLSYSRVDSEFALRLVKDLRLHGQFVWLDQIDIPPGVRFDREIEKVLRESRVLLVILSPESVASENVQDEIAFALKNGKRIIPLMRKPCEIPYRIERLQYIDFTKNYQNGLNALTQILSKLPVEQSPLPLNRPPIVDTHPTPDLPGQMVISHPKQVSKVRIVFAFSILAVLALLIYLLIKNGTNDKSGLIDTGTLSTSDSAKMKKPDTDTFSKVPGVSTSDRQVDTNALKVSPVSVAQNGPSKSNVPTEEVKAKKATKREAKFLGSYPLIFTSQGSLFPIACDASGAYAVYEDHVVVTFSNMKFTYLGQEIFPNRVKGERKIEALSMFLINRAASDWGNIEESNIIQYQVTLQPEEEVFAGSKTFKIPITDVESLNGFEFNIRIYVELAKGSHQNAFSKTLFTSPLNN